MEWTSEKIKALLEKVEKKQGEAFMTNDFDALGLCYHPDAVLIHKGVGVYNGRKAAQDALAALFRNQSSALAESQEGTTDSTTDSAKSWYSGITTDGEYLVRRGFFKIPGNPKEYPFEVIYKKVDGEYLIYYDAFEYSP